MQLRNNEMILALDVLPTYGTQNLATEHPEIVAERGHPRRHCVALRRQVLGAHAGESEEGNGCKRKKMGLRAIPAIDHALVSEPLATDKHYTLAALHLADYQRLANAPTIRLPRLLGWCKWLVSTLFQPLQTCCR